MMSGVTDGNGGSTRLKWMTADGEWLRRTLGDNVASKSRLPSGQASARRDAHGRRDDHADTIWRRRNGQLTPWVFVAPSAVLRAVTAIGDDPKLGLYAWKEFDRDET